MKWRPWPGADHRQPPACASWSPVGGIGGQEGPLRSPKRRWAPGWAKYRPRARTSIWRVKPPTLARNDWKSWRGGVKTEVSTWAAIGVWEGQGRRIGLAALNGLARTGQGERFRDALPARAAWLPGVYDPKQPSRWPPFYYFPRRAEWAGSQAPRHGFGRERGTLLRGPAYQPACDSAGPLGGLGGREWTL